MFEMKSASFTVNDRTLLHPTDLRFEQGQVYGLIGHNGSGKSTLLKLLARQQPLSDGEILFDGKSLPDWGNREFARQVAYLPQHLPSAENLLGRELVEMGRYPWRGLLGRMEAEDHRQVERAIALTHTERFADRLVDTLSGGERGRVWLAMLLAQESRFILLDEPLAVGDVGPYQAWVGEPRLPAGVVDIGLRTQPNRELLAELKPDRILISPLAAPLAPTLSRIAPVSTIALYDGQTDLWQRLHEVTPRKAPSQEGALSTV